jgi:hypothetical protein
MTSTRHRTTRNAENGRSAKGPATGGRDERGEELYQPEDRSGRTSTTDPVLHLLPAELPDAFLALPAEEQAWRGRFFLIASSVTFGADDAMLWFQTLLTWPQEIAWMKAAVAAVPDAEIPKMVEGRRAFEQALLEAQSKERVQ